MELLTQIFDQQQSQYRNLNTDPHQQEEVVDPNAGIQSGGHETGGEQVVEHNDDQPLILFFVIFGLLAGSLLREINKKTKFPYTPMLIILGIILGHYQKSLGKLGRSVEILSKINPHMILFIFIPVLIFESAFNCDWFIFKRVLVNVLILAGPGVLLCAFMIGAIFKIFLQYGDSDFTWPGALMAGSVLSATDPVAVVALLKELGASPRFGTLIEGESLLNDGTAMVFYQLFLVMCYKDNTTPITAASVLTNFARSAGGGPLLGIAMGLLSSIWLRRVIRDQVLVSMITFFTCYLVFYIGEFTEVKVSGILALVVLGLFMSAYGKTSISSQSEHAVHTIWSFCQYGCETIIFLLTGVIIGVIMMGQSTIQLADWVKLIIFYFLCTISRGIMIWIFIPCLKRSGYGMSNKEFYVITWGGLRGALGLTLALMVGTDKRLDFRLRELTLFYMAGLATLTLLINGTTCKSLCIYINLIENPPIKQKLLKNAKKQLLLSCESKMEKLSEDKYLNLADWKEVKELTGQKELAEQVDQTQEVQLRPSQIALLGQEKAIYGEFDPKEVQAECRFRILRTLKSCIWESYEKGHTSAEGTRLLDYSCNIALEQTNKVISLWEDTHDYFTQFSFLKYVFKFTNWPILGDIAKNYITEHLALIYEVVTTFIICCHEASEILLQSPSNNEWIKPIVEEIYHEVECSEQYLSELMEQYQNIVTSIHTKRAAIEMLGFQQKFIVEYQQSGYLDDKDFIAMRKQLDQKIVRLQNHVFSWKSEDFHFFAMEFPIFKNLTKNEQKMLKHTSKDVDFKAGEVIFKQGDDITSIYVITKGSVKDQFGSYTVTNGIGSLLNYGNMVYQQKCVSTCTAITNVTLRALEFEQLKKYLEQNLSFEEKIYKGALLYCARSHKENAGILGQLTEQQINKVVSDSQTKLERFQSGKIFKCPNGAYVYWGEVQVKVEKQNETQTVTYSDLNYIPAGLEILVMKQTYILIFSKDFKRNLTLEEREKDTESKFQKHQEKEQKSQHQALDDDNELNQNLLL